MSLGLSKFDFFERKHNITVPISLICLIDIRNAFHDEYYQTLTFPFAARNRAERETEIKSLAFVYQQWNEFILLFLLFFVHFLACFVYAFFHLAAYAVHTWTRGSDLFSFSLIHCFVVVFTHRIRCEVVWMRDDSCSLKHFEKKYDNNSNAYRTRKPFFSNYVDWIDNYQLRWTWIKQKHFTVCRYRSAIHPLPHVNLRSTHTIVRLTALSSHESMRAYVEVAGTA